jgi:DNA processing protein
MMAPHSSLTQDSHVYKPQDVTPQHKPFSAPIADDELANWLALMRAPGVGPATFQALLEHFDSPRQVLEMPLADLNQRIKLPEATRTYLQQPDWEAVEADLQWHAKTNNHILTLNDARYPSLLREISDPPPLLFVTGDPALLQYPQLAMVGSRNPNQHGVQTACDFAKYLSRRGLVITSGLALGIDAASHRGALAGSGLTIAVAGTGLDRVYPASHKALAHDIAEQGALVSENVPGTLPKPGFFPRRNRIISGMSMGALVVEAARQSGSLITARLAMEQGREVFAIPGSIHNPLARGCHALIRQGAKLVETGEDIIEELGPLLGSVLDKMSPALEQRDDENVMTTAANLPATQQQVLRIIGFEPTSIDLVIQQSKLTAETVSSILVELELQGYITSQGGRYSRSMR